jgi:hypothetical protein
MQVAWNGPASGSRGGSLVLPTTPRVEGSGRTMLACPTPSRKRPTNQPGT